LVVLLLMQRTYWPVPLDTLAVGHCVHTHVSVTGTVAPYYPKKEDDGDVHIKLLSPSGRFVIAECLPALPCPLPKAGQRITVKGISRHDPEHGWNEIHPVESWAITQ
jgi:hypothetical protein